MDLKSINNGLKMNNFLHIKINNIMLRFKLLIEKPFWLQPGIFKLEKKYIWIMDLIIGMIFLKHTMKNYMARNNNNIENSIKF
jgi:hypothetical protein